MFKNKIALLKFGYLITVVTFFFLVYNSYPRKFVLPPIESFSAFFFYNGSKIELEEEEIEIFYNILKDVKYAWRPNQDTPESFLSEDFINVLTFGDFQINLIACPNEDRANNLKNYAFIRDYKKSDKIIVNDKELLDFLRQYITPSQNDIKE